MNEPEWIGYDVVLAIHDAQLAEHGGSGGIRDPGLLESALAHPQNLYHYSKDVTLARLAASYAVGITRNHPFTDGKKRTAWVTCAVFLELNGKPVVFPQEEVVQLMFATAAGCVTEEEFAVWLER